MEFLLSQRETPRLEWRDTAGSTNADLIALATSEAVPNFTVLATDNQTQGRGRLDRVWVTPPRRALAISVLLRPELSANQSTQALGWIPLLAGLAVAEALDELFLGDGYVSVKWPNDVLIGGLKVSGVLSELLPDSSNVVVGAGINVLQTADELPVPTATSLTLAGARLPATSDAALDLVLASYLARLKHWFGRFNDHGLNAETSGLRAAVVAKCSTIGAVVSAQLPSGTELIGRATGIDSLGRLELEVSGKPVAVAAGDIVHLRPAQ